MLSKPHFAILRFCFVLTIGLSVLVPPLFAQFVYVANDGSDTIPGGSRPSVFGLKINAATGALTIVPGSPFAAGVQLLGESVSIAVDPAGRFAYVANAPDNTISVFTINAASGALTAIPGSPFPGKAGLLIVDPTGKFIYELHSSDSTISGYSINATSGALAPILGSPFLVGAVPISMAINSAGSFMYVANDDDPTSTVSGYAIDRLTGALAPISSSPFPGGFDPTAVRVHVTGKFVYVFDGGNNSIRRYAADPTTGTLTFLDFTVVPNGAANIGEIELDATGKFLYELNGGSVNNIVGSQIIFGYQIDSATGALTLIPGAPFSDLNFEVASLAVDPTSRFAYIPGIDDNRRIGSVSGYSIDPGTGVLAALVGSPFVAGLAETYAPHLIAITPVIGECGTVFPASLSFANQATETSSNTEAVVFSNGEAAPLTMSNISVTGSFEQSNSCGTSLAGGAHCTINVTFVPTSPGSQAGVLTIVDSGPMSPHIVNLTGNGVAPDFSMEMAAGAPSTQTISAGGTATYSLVLSAAAGVAASVNLSCEGAPQNSICSMSPNVVNLSSGTQSTTTVTLATMGPAASAGIWNIGGQNISLKPWVLWLVALVAMGCAWRSRRIETFRPARGAAFVMATMLFAACGCANSKMVSASARRETPAGTYTITITGKSGTLAHATNLQLTVR